tara:strand:- start:56 stop:373 length:318 start_codon:yes stop_codon:yes gene_type:complete
MEESIFTKGQALRSLDPTAKWMWEGKEYSGITWDKTNKNPKPTESQIDAELKKLEDEWTANEYQRQRVRAYPNWTDQLDYIYHNGIDKWKTDIVDPVKAKYPKPS